MPRRRLRFRGSFERLQRVVAGSKVAGDWEWMPASFWQYRCHSGAILNWWPSTGTLNFQGFREAAAKFEQEFSHVVKRDKYADNRFA